MVVLWRQKVRPIAVATAASAFVLVAPALPAVSQGPSGVAAYFAIAAAFAVVAAKRLGVAFGSPRALVDPALLARALAGGAAVKVLVPLAVLPLMYAFGDAVVGDPDPPLLTWPAGIAAVVFGPIAEEWLFRGVWMDAFASWVRRGPLLWLLVGGLFAIAHLEFAAGALLVYFAAGTYLSYVRERWGNLWLCAAVHGAMNLMVLGAQLLLPRAGVA